MSVYVTGDIHGSIDISKLNTKNFLEQKNLSKKDYLIICGDFGLVWNNSKEEIYWRKWLNDKNCTVLFCDGNHEGFDLLNKYPVENWHGGKIHRIEDSVIHLMRGQVFNINGYKFFVMGGAMSVDKIFRKEYISWWKEEMPSFNEMNEGLDNLRKYNNKVDYIISHTCSSNTLKIISSLWGFTPKPEDALNKFFDIIEQEVEYKHWYFGHFHEDCMIKSNQTLLYNKIRKII
jgi:predicted phosphodiesterase